MVEKVWADASPEKRLFISLITRDISLAEALLDLIDNSVNAALEPFASDLRTADDYQDFLASKIKPKVQIELTVGSSKISIKDNASGISRNTAEHHVFRFGRDTDEVDDSDRLSVYGIGLKRAIFKCGNKIKMVSDHRQGGFELGLNVREWAKIKIEPWAFEITPRAPAKAEHGTEISISELHEDVSHRVRDSLFLPQLRDRISRTYSFFIGRVVDITVNGSKVEREPLEVGSNYSTQKFKLGKVSCNIRAGIAGRTGEQFRDRNAGWFVFCNGRAVLFADKSPTTGWAGAGLPIFQPKHRPFLGIVFFVSPDPEALPWTTTKAAVNEESSVWQEAKSRMVVAGRVVTNFLDKRYTDEGTEIGSADLQEAAGKRVSVFTAAVSTKERVFTPPKSPAAATTKIQYEVKKTELKHIENYLRRPGMGGSAVGRYTFYHFLKNEVGQSS
jgi:Histidine kinase-, DNA gyrase B-, and HSP90-like ATPase